MDKLLAKDAVALAHAIERSAELKARIVSADERELTGARALLNLGHTFAHALESATGYQSYLHGEAVAIGLVAAAQLSVALGLLPREECARIAALGQKAGLPAKLKAGDPDTDELYALMAHDKKVSAGKLRFVVVERMGQAQVVGDVAEKRVKDVWGTVR